MVAQAAAFVSGVCQTMSSHGPITGGAGQSEAENVKPTLANKTEPKVDNAGRTQKTASSFPMFRWPLLFDMVRLAMCLACTTVRVYEELQNVARTRNHPFCTTRYTQDEEAFLNL